MIKHKETLNNTMEQAEGKYNRIVNEMEGAKKKFETETQKLEENHNKALCITLFKGKEY